jgi:tRNA-uridine 2-sulfurtransferase
MFAATRAQLERVCFPLGDMLKSDVRTMAARLQLPVAEKPWPQDQHTSKD